jgi:hypothetical protein
MKGKVASRDGGWSKMSTVIFRPQAPRCETRPSNILRGLPSKIWASLAPAKSEVSNEAGAVKWRGASLLSSCSNDEDALIPSTTSLKPDDLLHLTCQYIQSNP